MAVEFPEISFFIRENFRRSEDTLDERKAR